MKTLLFLPMLLAFNAHAACNTGAIGYVRESGFSISFGGGSSKSSMGDSTSINIPLTINGQQACYREKSKLSLKAEDKNNIEKSKIRISPVKVEFENVPDAHFKQYLFIEKGANNLETKFYRMTFICSGEIPLSYDASMDNYTKVVTSTENSANVSTAAVFATGAAAENLKKAKAIAPESQLALDFFAKLYKDKTNKELKEIPCCDQKVPSVLTASSVNSLGAVEKSIVSKFTTMDAQIPNGCSNEFSTSMSEYLFENYEQNSSFKDFSVSKKWFSDDLVFEFKQ